MTAYLEGTLVCRIFLFKRFHIKVLYCPEFFKQNCVMSPGLKAKFCLWLVLEKYIIKIIGAVFILDYVEKQIW